MLSCQFRTTCKNTLSYRTAPVSISGYQLSFVQFCLIPLPYPIVSLIRAILHRSSHQRCSIRKGVLRNFAKFTGKRPCQSLLLNKVGACNSIKKVTLAQVFSYEFCKTSKNTFFTEHLWMIWMIIIDVCQSSDYSLQEILHFLTLSYLVIVIT